MTDLRSMVGFLEATPCISTKKKLSKKVFVNSFRIHSF
jgi:hypothetical protein